MLIAGKGLQEQALSLLFRFDTPQRVVEEGFERSLPIPDPGSAPRPVAIRLKSLAGHATLASKQRSTAVFMREHKLQGARKRGEYPGSRQLYDHIDRRPRVCPCGGK